jgi:hypothetical protein
LITYLANGRRCAWRQMYMHARGARHQHLRTHAARRCSSATLSLSLCSEGFIQCTYTTPLWRWRLWGAFTPFCGMAPRVPKGNHRDPFVKTILPKPTRRGSSQQPLLLSATDYRKALDGHDAPLSTCYLFFISFFFYACGASLVMIQNVCVARNAPTPTPL